MYFDDVTTNEELIEKYRKLQKKYHPDNFQDEEEIEKNTKIFQEIGEEYKLKVEELLQEEFKKIEKKHKAPNILQILKNAKKNMTAEQKQQGANLVDSAINLGSGMLSNALNRKLWS
jgi:curved DNA-binding protein CbpA